MLHVACRVLHVACGVSHVACHVFYAACHVVYAACGVLYAACFTLTVLRGTLHVRAQVWHMYIHGPAFEEARAPDCFQPPATPSPPSLVPSLGQPGPDAAPQPYGRRERGVTDRVTAA